MKLYEINQEIESIISAIEPDPETGALPENEAELLDKLDTLAADRTHVLEWLAKSVLNARAESDAAKNEAKRLTERAKRATNRAERLTNILARECGGKKTDLGVATLSYRKSTRTVIDDETACLDWLSANAPEAVKVERRADLSRVKELLKDGAEMPAHLETYTGAVLK